MSGASIYPDIRSACREQLLGVNNLPTDKAWEGINYNPTVGNPFLRETLVPSTAIPIANGIIAYVVIYTVTLFYPSGAGTLDIERMAGAIMDRFKVGTTLSYGSTNMVFQRCERQQIVADPEWVSAQVRAHLIVNSQG